MNRIKSAFERAMERAEQFEEPGEQQRLEWELLPMGQRLAGSFLKRQGSPFSTIGQESPERRPYLVKGMLGALVSNLQLPRTEAVQYTNNRVIEGLERLLTGRADSKDLLQRTKYVTDQYRQFGLPQREQAYAQLKAQMERHVADIMSRQGGQNTGALPVNVETMPEFQQQWLAVSAQIDQQYEQHLEQFKKELTELV